MEKAGKNKSPSLANWIASRFISEVLLEEFLGDLKEIYEDRISTKGRFYAKMMYWVDVLHLLLGFSSLNLFKNQSSPVIMYKHYLIITGRNLLRNKVYSLINIGGLAVGMGVCLVICQYIYFELSYDDFHDNVQNTYRITLDETKNGVDHAHASTTFGIGPTGKETIPEIQQYVRIHPQSGGATLTNSDNQETFKELAQDMLYVDITFLKVFDFPLKLGDRESVFDEKFNIVITEKTAQKYFGSVNPIGKTLNVGGDLSPGNYIVSGVLEELPINSHLQFEFLLPMQNLLEFAVFGLLYKNSDGWERNNFVTYVTLDETANLDFVQEKLDQLIVKHKGGRSGKANIVEKTKLQPVVDIHLKSNSYARTKFVTNNGNIKDVQTFSIIAAFILLIAWVNYINLSTARSIHRAKEVGIRKSIGAFKRQLIIQFIMESVLVGLVAAILAIGIAFLALPALSQVIGKELEMSLLHLPIFGVWFLIVIIFGSLLSGLYPALIISAFKPISMLSTVKTARTGRVNIRRGLITFQFLVSLLLTSGTYLVYKQISFMKNQELGIDMEKILVLDGPEKNLDPDILQAFRTEVARHHSISAVSGSGTVPGKGHSIEAGFQKLGEQESRNQYGRIIWVGLNFPETYDFEFLSGNSFTQDMSYVESAIIINEEAVRTYGLGSPEIALQKKLIRVRGIDDVRTYKIIGVVKNFHWHSLRDVHTPYLFLFSPDQGDYFSFKMNLTNIPESLSHIESTYNSFFPNNPFDYFFLEDEFNRQYQSDVQFGNIFFAFTALAIFIACIGLFALVSFSAILRIKEIGIRKVLGASISNLMILLSKEYFILLSIAIVIAIPAILYWGNAWLDNYAFRTDIGFDLLIIPITVLVVISVLTVSHRTYSTAKSNPVESLRAE